MDKVIYNKLSDKAKKEIDSILDTVMVEEYRRISYSSLGLTGEIYDNTVRKSKTVIKQTKKYYIGYQPLENQDLLKALYEAELRIMELERLEESVNNIKQFITKGEK